MEKSTLKLTRKIQILIDLPTKEEKKEALDKLYQWQNRCFRAANLIVTHLYVQEMIKAPKMVTSRQLTEFLKCHMEKDLKVLEIYIGSNRVKQN